MPPRKRAQSATKTEEPDEQTTPAAEDDEAEAAEPQHEGDATPDEPEPERSDVRTGGEPCGYCFPGGWAARADIVGAVGCEHGTWQREVR